MIKDQISTIVDKIPHGQTAESGVLQSLRLNAQTEEIAVHKTLSSKWTNRRLFSLFWPLVVEQLLIVTMGVADMVMVSSVGMHAVSGVNLVDTLNFLLITAFTALATGGSVVTSQYIGRGDRENINLSAKQLIYISIIISMFTMILTAFLRGPMLSLIFGSISDDVMTASRVYLLITALSYPFLALYSASAALFRSMGNSKITMKVALVVNIINIGGNAIFIYGLKLGVMGAAWATFIGRFIAAYSLFYLLIKKPSVGNFAGNTGVISLKGIMKVTLDFPMIGRILNIAVPSGLEASMFQVGKILITRIFTLFGTVAIAANAVSSTINSIAFMPGSGFGMGLLIIVGQCIGAGDYGEVKRNTKKIIILTYMVYFFINLNVVIFMHQIIGFFDLSPESHGMCVTFLRVHCVTSTLFWTLSFVLPNALKAAGDAKYTMIVAASTMWIVRVSLAYIMAFPLGLGPVAVWIAMGADFLFRGIFFTARWRSGRWMTKRVI